MEKRRFPTITMFLPGGGTIINYRNDYKRYRIILELSRKYPGIILELSRNYLGNIPELSWNDLGIIVAGRCSARVSEPPFYTRRGPR